MKPEISNIVYPWEYFAAMVFWALKISKLKKVTLTDAMLEYTDLYGSLTEESWDKRLNSDLWNQFLDSIKNIQDPTAISDIAYNLYLKQDHSIYANKLQISSEMKISSDKVSCGPLELSFDEYNRERESVRIHYNPTRQEKSWLSSERFSELQEAFKKLLEYSYKNYDAKYFTSSTWLNNIPNFIKLFPQSFNKNMKDIGGGSYFGLWGQFVRSTGQGNKERFEEFIKNLSDAKSFEQAQKSIPMKVFECIGPISDFYNMYEIGTN
jgi:hypothetical protein